VPPGFGFRTGFSEARATDLEDDSYDLSWWDDLSGNVAMAIQQLRTLLATVADPIDRHYMMAELEHRLYGCRGAFASALDEYDEVCRQHDAAMDEIRAALFAKFGRAPDPRHLPAGRRALSEGRRLAGGASVGRARPERLRRGRREAGGGRGSPQADRAFDGEDRGRESSEASAAPAGRRDDHDRG